MRVVGYLPEYRYSLFGQMDLNQVTHINYFSIGVTADGTLTAEDANVSHMATVVSAMHALGKTVSITLGPASFATMASTATSRDNFANNIANYITANNLDGVDIDWEPPASTTTNQTNYGLLINTLVAKLHPMGKLVTAAVNPWTHEIPAASANQMDWLNIMCYDFDYANSSTYSASVGGMNGWTSFGVAKDKLVMGVPFYGRYGTSGATPTPRPTAESSPITRTSTAPTPLPTSTITSMPPATAPTSTAKRQCSRRWRFCATTASAER